MKMLATTLVLCAAILGALAAAGRFSADPPIDDSVVNEKLDAQIRLTLAKLRQRTELGHRQLARFP